MKRLMGAAGGLFLWAFGFATLYGLHGLGCAWDWNDVVLAGGSLFRWVLTSTWLLLCIGGAGIAVWAWHERAGFYRKVAIASSLAGLVATIVIGLPIILTSICR